MVLLNQSKLFKLSQSPRQTEDDLNEEKRTLMNDLFTDVTAVPSIVIDSNNNTDIQPKISIDEISLLWLFCGC